MLVERPSQRSDDIQTLIDGVERYNLDNLEPLEEYLDQQIRAGGYDCLANLAILKLYQFNPQVQKTSVIMAALLKALTAVPADDFSLHLHLLPPYVLVQSPRSTPDPELCVRVRRVHELYNALQSAQYAKFWRLIEDEDEDSLIDDMILELGYEAFHSEIRYAIARELSTVMIVASMKTLRECLGFEEDSAVERFVHTVPTWSIEQDGVHLGGLPSAQNVRTEGLGLDQLAQIIHIKG